MKRYRHIEALLKFYYRGLAGRKQATLDDLQATQARINELERLITSGKLIPSVGVSHYEGASTYAIGMHGDPTAVGAAAYEHEKAHFERELARLHAWQARLAGELYEYEQLERHVATVLRMMEDDVRTVIERRYRDKQSLYNLAIACSCDESTLRYHLQYAYSRIDAYMQSRLSAKTLPFFSRFSPECFPDSSREAPRFRRSLMVG